MSNAGAPPPLTSVLIRGAWGAVLLLAPNAVLATVTGGRPPPPAAASPIVRALGVRHLTQAGLEARRPTAGVFALGALADTLHAASALALVAAARTWRRTGTIDAVVAAGFGLAAVRQVRARSS